MIRIQKGLVKYKDRSDIICTYGTSDDGKMYYFLEGEKLNNGYIIASTALVEAIDPLVVASSIGVIDSKGKEIIPFENKSIKPVSSEYLLVEKSSPVTQSVIDAVNSRRDPLAATKLVTTSATIKEKMYNKMGPRGRFLFNDQFSEVAFCDLDGNNLFQGKYFSFVGINDKSLFLCGNLVDSVIEEYPLEKEDNKSALNNDFLDVRDALVNKEVIDTAMEKDEKVQEEVEKKDIIEDSVNVEAFQGMTEKKEEEVKQEEDTIDSHEDNNFLENNFIKPVNVDKIDNNLDFMDNDNSNKFSGFFDTQSDDEGEEKSKADDYKNDFSFVNDMNNDFSNDLDEVNETSFLIDNSISSNKRSVSFFDDSSSSNVDLSTEDDKDNVFEDTALVISRMISQIEEQRQTLSAYEDKLKKLNDFRQKAFEENKKLVHRYENLFQEHKKLESVMLDQKKTIAEQQEKITYLREQVAGKNELVKLLAKAQNLLDESDYEKGFSKMKTL